MKYILDISIDGTPFPSVAGHATIIKVFDDGGNPIVSLSVYLRYTTSLSPYVMRNNLPHYAEFLGKGWAKFERREDFVAWFITHAKECYVIPKEPTP